MIIRAFIAIELPEIIQQAIIKQTARLRQNISGDLIRWTPVGNIHLTLKFLGDVPSNHLDFVKQSLAQTAKSSLSFDLQVGGLGSFPNSKQPRILWVGIHAPPELNTLQENIDTAMDRLGYKKEDRPFSPHLTLGRARPNISPENSVKIRDTLQSIQLGNIGTARVNSVHLIKSNLNSTGPEYTNLFSANLKQ
jgi:2'-5' RNA ligase